MRQLDLTERLLRLRGVPVFRSMSTSDLAPLAASMRSAVFEKGDVLLREDEPPRSFHLLLTGAVTMRRHGNVLRTLTAPGGVGFLSVLARNAGSTEAIAESHTETFEVRSDALDEMFEDHFSVLLETMRWVAERLIQENIQQKPPPYNPPKDGLEHLIGDRELGIVERIFLLRRSLIFKQANVNSTARLARRMQEVRLPAGQTVWRVGDKADSNIIIVKGRMATTWKNKSSGTGPEKSAVIEEYVQELGPGYIVGGAESIANQPRWNELVTHEPVVFLRGGRDALIDMFEDDLDVALKFQSMLANFLLTSWDAKAEAGARLSSMPSLSTPIQPTTPPPP